MTTKRRRPVVRWTALTVGAIALLAILAIAWLVKRESPAVELSRTIRVGMSRDEVERILGIPELQVDSEEETTLLYGSSGAAIQMMAIADHAFDTEAVMDNFDIKAWPVRVSVDHYDRRVIRIERGDEVEE